MSVPQTENVVGAVIFISYIAAALFFTCFITRDLISLYSRSHDVKSIKERSVAEVVQRREKGQLFIALSFISFAALSYQMLGFLIESYMSWGRVSGKLSPATLMNKETLSKGHLSQLAFSIWTWSKQSTLFQDFAEIIVNSNARWWWTQQSLLYSMGWNIFMAVEGTRYQIPHLWTYYVLDQILPISFTQNLFCAAVFFSQNLPQTANLKAAAPGDQFVVVFLYLMSLSITPNMLGTTRFFAIVFAIRALLFVPYWMLKPSIIAPPVVAHGLPESLHWKYRYSALVLAVGGMFLHIRQTQAAAPVVMAAKAIGDNYAVGTLGYDYLIGVSSLMINILLGRTQ